MLSLKKIISNLLSKDNSTHENIGDGRMSILVALPVRGLHVESVDTPPVQCESDHGSDHTRNGVNVEFGGSVLRLADDLVSNGTVVANVQIFGLKNKKDSTLIGFLVKMLKIQIYSIFIDIIFTFCNFTVRNYN